MSKDAWKKTLGNRVTPLPSSCFECNPKNCQLSELIPIGQRMLVCNRVLFAYEIFRQLRFELFELKPFKALRREVNIDRNQQKYEIFPHLKDTNYLLCSEIPHKFVDIPPSHSLTESYN